MQSKPIVYVVDDEAEIREALRITIELMDLDVACFASGLDFLEAFDPSRVGCLILDLRMPEMNGLELLGKTSERGLHLPAIMISGQGDIRAAVHAMSLGAVDFLEKPYQLDTLRSAILKAIASHSQGYQTKTRQAELVRRLAMLTPDEEKVLDLTISGKPDKAIAARLELSTRTIQFRRASIMKKLQATSRAELIQLAQLARGASGD